MSNNLELQANCVNIINNLFKEYENNEHMLRRVQKHIVDYLPNTIANEFKNYEKRINRNNYLSNEQQIFIQVFLSKNRYFYLPNNNFFYEYNGKNYFIIKEDDVIHKLLSSISKDRVLMQWKYKTKKNIIKQIRQRNLFSSIPETDTIQNVLSVLYPSVFSSKNAAKYFLTIIGDNLFKKNSHLIFLINNQMKKLLVELDSIALDSIGHANTTFNFMTKYHENHSYENCRLIKINEHFSTNIWRDVLKRIGLDLLCVAAHYSKRYENSDKFIENKSDEELKSFSYYLKFTTANAVVLEFRNKYITDANSNNKMEWRNVHFLWKQFLCNGSLPNVIYSHTLKNIMKEMYSFDEATDTFIGITSKYLPAHSDFIKFWENTISVSNCASDVAETFVNELEIDELSYLFKLWAKQTNEHLMSNGNITEENILKILKHFFPTVEIVEDKFVLNVKCVLWDKISDINSSFTFIKEQIKGPHNASLISFDDAYNYYNKFCSLNAFKSIVSKRYFEKYLHCKMPNHIAYEKFIQVSWFLNNE